MKNLTLLVLCCFLIFSLFACGSSNSQQQDENNPDADKEIAGSQGQPDTPNEEDTENSDTNTSTPNIKASEGLEYTLSDDGAYYKVVSIGECTDTDIIIPSKYKDLPVTVIAEGAFAYQKDIASITIPKSIAIIESSVFYRCTSLLNINVEKSNTNFSSIDGNLYSKDGKKLIQYAVGKSETLFKIPDGVTDIRTYAFRDCDGLTGIIIPTSLTRIDYRAFAKCDNLAQIFYEGTSRDWNDISISKDGNDVLKSAKRYYYFEDIPPRINYYWHYENGTATIWNKYKDYPYSIGLYYDKNPDGESYCVTGVGDCSDLRVIIPNEYNGLPVTKIADSVFENQYTIKSVTVPENVVTIGKNAFRNCHALETVYLPEDLSSIGSYAFSYCHSLLSINVDEKNEYYCSIDGNLYTKDEKTLIKYASGKKDSDFIIPNTIACVCEHAFNKCMYLVNITIPDSVMTIENGAFSECKKITSVILPNSISMIDDSMFYNCPALTSVVIPDSVTSIGDLAFCDCPNLQSVYYTGTVEDWASMSIGFHNAPLTNATLYCYSETEPADEGNFWGYNDDGAIIVW